MAESDGQATAQRDAADGVRGRDAHIATAATDGSDGDATSTPSPRSTAPGLDAIAAR